MNNNAKQLYHKDKEEYKSFFPIVRLEDIIETITDKSIQWLFNNYNHIYVEFKESVAETRNKVPNLLRRNGLWITYNTGTELVTEQYIGSNNNVENYRLFTDDEYWKRFDDNEIKDGSITYDKLAKELQNLISDVDIVNNPDEEDLTTIDNKLKIKDREYNKDNFSGLGHVILRKNIKSQNGKFINILTQDMIDKPNTIYEIRYDFDLNGEEVTIPEGCSLKFDGGSFRNGSVVGDITVYNINYEQIKLGVFIEGYNYTGSNNRLLLSEVGMIPNDETRAEFNFRIFSKVLSRNKDIVVDNNYYLLGDGIEIKNLNIIGQNGKLYIQGSLFKLGELSSIDLNKCSFEGGTVITINDSLLSYEIENIHISDCEFINNVRIIKITGADIDYNVTPFGIKNVIIERNKIDTVFSSFELTDIVFKNGLIFRNNIISNFKYVLLGLGTSNDYINSNNNVVYQGDVIIESNIVNGSCTEEVTYQTIAVAEVNRLILRNNKISNVISIDGPSYDCYASSIEYICENNIFINVIQLPSNTDIIHYSEIFKSKGRDGGKRLAKNNTWIIDFEDCRKLIKEQLNITINDEIFNQVNHISIFGFTSIINNVEFINNKINILNGNLHGARSSYPVKEMLFHQNYINIANGQLNHTMFPWRNKNTYKIEVIDNVIYSNNAEQLQLFGYNSDLIENIPTIICRGNKTSVPIEFGGFNNSNIKIKKVIFENNIYDNIVDYATNQYFVMNVESASRIETYTKNHTKTLALDISNTILTEYISEKTEAFITHILRDVGNSIADGYIITIDEDMYIIKKDENVVNIYDRIGSKIDELNSSYKYNTQNKYTISYSYIEGSYVAFGIKALIPLKVIFKKNVNINNILPFVSKGKTDDRATNLTEKDAGTSYFDTSLKRMIWWDGAKWTDSPKGTTTQRPTGVNDGFEYYDTTIRQPIYWNESRQGWINADGYAAGVRSGRWQIRKDLQEYLTGLDSGLQFFDLQLGKVVVWTGYTWVNVDGSGFEDVNPEDEE